MQNSGTIEKNFLISKVPRLMDEKVKVISEATLRRLPRYHHMLQKYLTKGLDTVSCSQIAEELRYDPTQIRKDLAVTGIKGRPKVGYDLTELIKSIEEFLGWTQARKAVLVGTGHLGSALLGYSRFHHYGLDIVAAFDKDPERVGSQVHGREVMPITELDVFVKKMLVEVGIITAPAMAAQGIASLMTRGGIRAIWNFAPVKINVPDGVIVLNEDLYSSLGVLLQKLNVAAARK